ncbi:MAG: transglutaminase domain-containing protein [Candidatus Cloacimonas sp.]|nr:transglutaminase domain-containing protein [Candidatus Cloacimonas sp.]
MKTALLIASLLFSSLLIATPRGLTTREIPVSDVVVSTQEMVSEFIQVPQTQIQTAPNRDAWLEQDYLNLNMLLPAGAQYGFKFNNSSNVSEPYGSMGALIPESKQAIRKAPTWMRAELSGVLAQLEPAKQLIWADLINTAVDPYVDEISFCVANSSPQYLSSSFALPQMFTENAVAIYAMAGQLPYVQIVDTGQSLPGGNYYSTTSYYKKNASGQTVQISVPQELYYWYIVHPKLTDEIAAYIDPAIIENNSTHTNNIAEPPVGKFWRTYLYSLTEGEYPVLSDSLRQCQTLFNRDGSTNDAIHAVQTWINSNMSFNSNNERPHQPVRIIAKRMGRCGEYADLTAACARLALIPCTSISSVSTDHTWNEFWDEDWVAWEPVNGYINNPLVYENGWGKVFGSVFETRSDGLFTPVTQRYSEGQATILIQVVDSTLRPVDGARVVLAILDTTNRFDCEQYTDNDGMVNFSVGENRNYRARTETTFGLWPAQPGTYMQLVENTEAGQIYPYMFVIPVPMPVPSVEQLPAPADPIQDHRFRVSFQSYGYYITGLNLWDDIDVLGLQPSHYKAVNTLCNASFMVMDSDNQLFWSIDHFGSAYSYLSPTANGNTVFNIPVGQDWYAFVDNSHRHRNAVQLSGEMFFESWGSAVTDEVAEMPAIRLLNNYPNPFTSSTTYALELSKQSELSMAIYNLKGQKVRSFPPVIYAAGKTQIAWDGKGDRGENLASGVYLWKTKCGTVTQSSKVMLVK